MSFKKLKKLSSAVFIFTSFATFADPSCVRTESKFLCSGDNVVLENGTWGYVLAVNGCSHTAAVTTGHGDSIQHPMAGLALQKGCVESLCVHDSVYDARGRSASVVGVNPFSNQVAITYGYGDTSFANLQDLATGRGCHYGYCVLDDGTDIDGRPISIMGVNTSNDKVAITYGNGAVYIVDLKTVSLGALNKAYGTKERSLIIFPMIDPSLFLTPSLHYAEQRPVSSN